MLEYSLDDLVGVRDGVEVSGGVDEPEDVGLQQVVGRIVRGEGLRRRVEESDTVHDSIMIYLNTCIAVFIMISTYVAEYPP